MTVTQSQKERAVTGGMRQDATEAAAKAADQTGATFYQILALLAKETTNGANVYGNDIGGTFAGFKDPVTECNYRAFWHETIVMGRPSNGVGPLQATYKGFHTDMKTRGLKAWEPMDSVPYLADIYWGYYRRARAMGYSHSSGVKWAGSWFNAGPDEDALVQPYADKLLELANKWRGIVGIEDTH